MFWCAKCDQLRDSDSGCAEVDGKLICEDCEINSIIDAEGEDAEA